MSLTPEEAYIIKVGKRISSLRQERKMTQLELATTIDIEENSLWRIEKGRTNPTLKILLQISKGLNVEIVELFDFE